MGGKEEARGVGGFGCVQRWWGVVGLVPGTMVAPLGEDTSRGSPGRGPLAQPRRPGPLDGRSVTGCPGPESNCKWVWVTCKDSPKTRKLAQGAFGAFAFPSRTKAFTAH